MLGYLRSQIYQENLKHISGIHQAYPRQSSAIFLAKLSHITGISQTNHRHTSDIYPYSLPFFFTVCIQFLYYTVYLEFQYRFSTLSQTFLIGFSILSQSSLDTLKTYQNFRHTFKSQSLSPHSHVISCLFSLASAKA